MNDIGEKPARRGRRQRAGAPRPVLRASGSGGRYAPLAAADLEGLHEGVLDILGGTGMAGAPPEVIGAVTAAGGRLADDARLLFPPELVERALAGLPRAITLHGQAPGHELRLEGARVHTGSGGAAPMVVDLDTGAYRPSTLADLHAAARLVDALENVHFFSRSLVARDMPDASALDINTAFAALAGTAKHVSVSASDPAHVADIAAMACAVAGSEAAFRARPFLSLNVNHAVPPLRFDPAACAVMAEAARAGIPVMVNTFGQLGASSPVTMAGCIAQTVAETLAGMIWVWLVNPGAPAVFGPRPMVTDLRTGAMAGGAGEQALLTAAAIQMARFYDLPSSTIAGATDSKLADAQAGYEKALAVTLAAQAGANLVTQAAGMQAGLMAASFEAYVIDNDMLGAILRSLAPVEVSGATLSPGDIGRVARGEGHFLGDAETLARMESDFLYPRIADRRPPETWAEDGARSIREVARDRAREVLATHFPDHLDGKTEAKLRRRFDIRLPEAAMRAP